MTGPLPSVKVSQSVAQPTAPTEEDVPPAPPDLEVEAEWREAPDVPGVDYPVSDDDQGEMDSKAGVRP